MQAWDDFLNAEEHRLGKEVAAKWLRSLRVIRFDACNLYLEAKDPFQIRWFEEHVRPGIQTRLQNNNSHPIKVHLKAASTEPSEKKPPKKKWEPSLLKITSDPLDSFATFEHFAADGNNQIPYQLLYNLEQGSFNPIFLHGPTGSGKTHLLMAMAAKTKQKVLFVNAETFTEHVVQAIRLGWMQEFRNAYRKVDLLIIDDIHLFAKRTATQEEFFHTFNALNLEKKQIVLSSALPPHLLQGIEERLISRFEWGITLCLEKPGRTAL
jgi:chromosomal replication initiator protein